MWEAYILRRCDTRYIPKQSTDAHQNLMAHSTRIRIGARDKHTLRDFIVFTINVVRPNISAEEASPLARSSAAQASLSPESSSHRILHQALTPSSPDARYTAIFWIYQISSSAFRISLYRCNCNFDNRSVRLCRC